MGKSRGKPHSSDSSPKKLPMRRPVVRLRIIAGEYRGQRLLYDGDPRIRPMKDRLREAVFNILGSAVREKLVLDLFAGTGALGLEALSRGAAWATCVEIYRPAAQLVRRNITLLGVQDKASVVEGDIFKLVHIAPADLLGQTSEKQASWLVFCSPPYEFYVRRCAEMISLIATLVQMSPSGSIFVVEADARFDFRQLPQPDAWDVRAYRPAKIGVFHKP